MKSGWDFTCSEKYKSDFSVWPDEFLRQHKESSFDHFAEEQRKRLSKEIQETLDKRKSDKKKNFEIFPTIWKPGKFDSYYYAACAEGVVKGKMDIFSFCKMLN